MGEAREVMDRITRAAIEKDIETLGSLYAPDAVAVDAALGEVKGRDAIIELFKAFIDPLPDFKWEPLAAHESGNTAIDEGYVVGTNTAPITLPSGEAIPATGKSVRLRSCDIATVENGLVTRHHFYYDQMEFLGQLGLLPDAPSAPTA